MNNDAFQASARFGLGPTLTELSQIQGDPRGWLLAQLRAPNIPFELKNLSTLQIHGAMGDLKKQLKTMPAEQAALEKKEIRKETERAIRDLYMQQTATRILVQAASPQPFIERLVIFWSNHFTVSIQRPQIAGLVNAFEAEAIRPHITGKFYDMLVASSQHPAMLLYLDNAHSIGPNSQAGLKREKGLNENLAREILELHTLGPTGGYAQADVIAFAKMITGWSITNDDSPKFKFTPIFHEPGDKVFMGATYKESGMHEGMQALHYISRHPATAKHIAIKLARHFVSDTPPDDIIEALSDIFLNTDGDLGALSRAIVNLKACWETPLAKFKTPYEYFISALRLTGFRPEKSKNILGLLQSLNFKPFNANAPIGYADDADTWASPDAILKRIEFAQILAKRLPPKLIPVQLAEAAFGPVMREETAFIVNGAASGADGIAFVLSAPEFMRR